ncbi:hypothetical protein Ga0100230_006000 [Opitutaceae bacterium TAV3]|nr:hypothetical protein Ga0100230_006000 [Opitutaceae bacterium TAV3]
MTRILCPLALSLLIACAPNQASAQDAAEPQAQLLAKYTFEGIPAHIPDWGGGVGSVYKPATGWKTPFTVKLDTNDPHSGGNSLRIELLETTNGEKIVHTPSIKIPLPETSAPGKVSIRLYIRTQGIVEKGALIRGLERDEKGKIVRYLGNKKELFPVPETATWQEFTTQATLAPNTRSISVMLSLTKEQTSPATVWLDDISVELQPAPTP